jgi:hypothetical protein
MLSAPGGISDFRSGVQRTSVLLYEKSFFIYLFIYFFNFFLNHVFIDKAPECLGLEPGLHIACPGRIV